MEAFISYSHQDSAMLDLLHKHLAQLKREGIITTWTDRNILAGGHLDRTIAAALANSKLFIALLSPDYIASNYCYEKEFQTAMEMQERGQIIIVPVVVEPCDWQSTPFQQFKALPKDGKAASTWENKNTAFLDVIQNIRKLITSPLPNISSPKETKTSPAITTRNYRVQKDFDSIEKMEFQEKTFHEVKNYLRRYLEEIDGLENIKTRVLKDTNKEFQSLLVNRNKIDTEAQLHVSIEAEGRRMGFFSSSEHSIHYSIAQKNRPVDKNFTLAHDAYRLYWTQNTFYGTGQSNLEFTSKDMADSIWNEWLESVGILDAG